jgi:glycosyltransferase involved in cell wall biosynthesis
VNNKFVIVSATYNTERFIGRNIVTSKKQKYKNFKHIIIDDMSTDRTYEAAKKYIDGDERYLLIKNETKCCSLENIYNVIYKHTEENDIVVILDGDDLFASQNVLSILNDVYNTSECLLTYGSYMNLSNKERGKFSKELPEWVIEKNLFREYAWCTSHLRSFRSSLFKKIKEQDLKNSDDKFYDMAGDLAIMFPMLEMAGKNSYYIKDILYIWNDESDLNEHKIDNAKQVKNEREVRSKEKYNAIK